MRQTLATLTPLVALSASLSGQAKSGHFYHVNYYQVRPGQEQAYDSAIVTAVTPVLDQLLKRKAIVSYHVLSKVAGSGENTHLVLVEVTAVSEEGSFQRSLETASQAVFHKSWDDLTARFPELRRFIHAELYKEVRRGP